MIAELMCDFLKNKNVTLKGSDLKMIELTNFFQKTTPKSVFRKILIADDNRINRQILNRILIDEYEVIEAENGQIAIDILKANYKTISAVLLDIIMPIKNGYDVLKEMHEDEEMSKIPVIVTTGNDSEEAEIKSLALGANDFLLKPYNPIIIKHRLANTIKFRETAAFVNSIEKDPLTGLLNKEFFYKKAETIINENSDKKYDIICSDIEKFKLVNDLFGEKVGDDLLKYVADKMMEYSSSYEISGRIGSDKFAYLLLHSDKYENSYFENANKAINEFPVNISLIMRYGIYSIVDDSLPVSTMCDRALLACNSIKGKYQVFLAYYDDKLRQALLSEQLIIHSMKTALQENQFKVYYQPKYDLLSNKIAGAEALVRWIHPEKGFMSPGEFIPIFEKNGFISDLDMFVWETACQNISNWIKAGNLCVPISVNVSRVDIYNPNLPTIILDLVKKYDLLPEILHLEITETAYTENPKQLIEVVEKLKSYGFLIEMDDFGTGYSSLNMLSELPINILKLDMKFIQNETSKNSSKNILSFIISLAKWLDLLVVAEGVETLEQVTLLRNMDCNYVQGYYFARPMSRESFENLLINSPIADEYKKSNQNFQSDSVRITKSKTDKVMLIIDDIELNRAILAEIFGEQFTIIEADNGRTAYAYIQENYNKIDIILLDLVMPIMDGFQMLAKLKIEKNYQKIPVIITSQAGAESESRALEMGASDFISKPYCPKVALRRVRNVIAYRKLQTIEIEDGFYNEIEKNDF